MNGIVQGQLGFCQVNKGEGRGRLHGERRNPVCGLMKALCITSRLTILALSSCYNKKMLKTEWFKHQAFISHSSGDWEV